jgi:hypothetical protein
MGDMSEELTVIEPRHMVTWTPRFALTVDQAVELVDQKREFMKRVMREGEHFGTISGTPKPTLYKPGAELLNSTMGLHSDSSINTVPPVIDLLGTEHGGEAFVMFQKTCEIYREEIPGERILIARASGNCNSWEKKYRYRKADRTCPTCSKTGTVIKGLAKYGGGWLCWKNKGGCGAKFTDTDKRITDQNVGDVPNPDIADLINTVEKIAAKRALVAATLLATGCSDIFTQDLEDGTSGGSDDERGPAVDQDGVIANPSVASREAVAAAQGTVAPSVGVPMPTRGEEPSDGVVPRPVGPRAKRGGNVVQAPKGAQSASRGSSVESATSASPVASETVRPPLQEAVADTLKDIRAKIDKRKPDGEEVFLATLRQQARESAAVLRQLRVRLNNAAGDVQPVPEATPSTDSDDSLSAYILDAFGKDRTLGSLNEKELADMLGKFEELTKRVEAKLKA